MAVTLIKQQIFFIINAARIALQHVVK